MGLDFSSFWEYYLINIEAEYEGEIILVPRFEI